MVITLVSTVAFPLIEFLLIDQLALENQKDMTEAAYDDVTLKYTILYGFLYFAFGALLILSNIWLHTFWFVPSSDRALVTYLSQYLRIHFNICLQGNKQPQLHPRCPESGGHACASLRISLPACIRSLL